MFSYLQYILCLVDVVNKGAACCTYRNTTTEEREHNDKSNNITREEIHLSAVYVYDECCCCFVAMDADAATTHIGSSIVGGYVDVCPKVTWRKGRHFPELIREEEEEDKRVFPESTNYCIIFCGWTKKLTT